MRSDLRFIMHPVDERDFVSQLLTDETVRLIDGPRWKTAAPQAFRALDSIRGSYCIIWSTAEAPTLKARYIPSRDDWYCESESATIQFLRSQVFGDVITEGRLAVNTSHPSEALGTAGAAGIERRFKLLSRFIKKQYANSVVQWCNPSLPLAPAAPGRSANPSKPDSQVWVGPQALQWLEEDGTRRIKQFTNSPVEARLVEAPNADVSRHE